MCCVYYPAAGRNIRSGPPVATIGPAQRDEHMDLGNFSVCLAVNMLPFNPGWDRTGSTLPEFDDVRDIQRTLESRGLVPTMETDEFSWAPRAWC